MSDIIINPGTSIQTTINNALSGDRILFNSGAYNADSNLNINKPLTLKPTIDGTYPNIRLNGTTYAYFLNFGASNITIDGLDIDNTRGGISQGYIHNTTAISNLTIKNSKIHEMRRMFFGDTGLVSGLTFLNNQIYRGLYTFLEIDDAKDVIIKNNWIHTQTNTTTGEAAITWYLKNDVGTSEISYNYIYGIRFGVELASIVPNAASIGSILVAHNTEDMYMLATHPASLIAPYLMRYGTSFWSVNPNTLNAAGITWRDNLITRTLVHGMYLGNTLFTSKLTVKNCMFFDNYWYYWPDTGRYTYEHLGHINARLKHDVPNFNSTPLRMSKVLPRGRHNKAIAGWGAGATQPSLVELVDCMVDDPFFTLTGATPPEFYALKPNSPAIGTASDHTNIGAWQG